MAMQKIDLFDWAERHPKAMNIVVFLAIVVLMLGSGIYGLTAPGIKLVPYEEFVKHVETDTETAVIGANVTLHQIIHKTDGTATYRYKVQTDCPGWGYDGRYESDEPLPFDLDHAAVEIKCERVTVNFNGDAYVTEESYEVPMLNLKKARPETEILLRQAYTQYEANNTSHGNMGALCFSFAMFLILVISTSAARNVVKGEITT